MSDHIGDDAALYALGILDEVTRRRIDAHVSACDACARILGEAEAEVAILAAAEQQYQPPVGFGAPVVAQPKIASRRPVWITATAAAVAAALVIGMMPSAFLWQQNRSMHDSMLAESAAMQQLADGRFRTASFAAMNDGSVARVMYAPDGSWYVVVVRGSTKALQVAWMHDGERTMLGTAQPHGDVAMLYLPKSHRMDQLALVDGPTVVAEAQLAY